MKTAKSFSFALIVVLAGLWIAPSSTAGYGDGDCHVCVWVIIPAPDGGNPIRDHICLSLGDEVGYQQCYECTNCDSCFMMFACYWP